MKLKKLYPVLAAVTLSLLTTGAAVAGSGGTEFDAIDTQLTDWMEGTLGKVLILAMLLVGIGIGIVQQSIMAVVVAVGGALALYNAPAVIASIFTATL